MSTYTGIIIVSHNNLYLEKVVMFLYKDWTGVIFIQITTVIFF